jgi:uncharacterized protein YcbX
VSDAPDVDAVLSRFFGRDLELAHAAQNGSRSTSITLTRRTTTPTGTATRLSRRGSVRRSSTSEDSRPLSPKGSFFDLFPLSVITMSSLNRLGELEPESCFDARRFRMNVIVETSAHGFVENEWPGRTLVIGDEVQIGVALPDPRCVMPSLAQEELPKDSRILRALAQHNRIDVAGALYPCAGVYAVAEATGAMSRDDSVSLI